VKITEVKSFLMASPRRDYMFVKIATDEGLHGWGEGTLERKQRTVAAAVGDLTPSLLGEDPTRVDHLWQRLYRHGFWRGGEAVLSAISAIEHALWDITGKAYGQPVYKLLGGAVRDYIPCYTHSGDVEGTRRYMEQGWRAFKFGPAVQRGGSVTGERELVRGSAAAFEAMREAVGPDVELMCDVHGRLRPSAAIRLGKALEPYDLLFFEEPVPPDTVHSLEQVRRAGLSMDIATGERAFTKWGFRDILERQLVDVIQPDICHDGGIKETVKIAAMAEAYEVLVAPHNPNGPVATAASVHAAAVMPNFLILEYADSPTRDACQAAGEADCFKARNGRIELPTRPGLGIELDEEYLLAHPMGDLQLGRGQYLADGTVANV